MPVDSVDRALLDAWLHSDQPLAKIAELMQHPVSDLAWRIVKMAAEGRCNVRRDLRGYYQRGGGLYAEREAGA